MTNLLYLLCCTLTDNSCAATHPLLDLGWQRLDLGMAVLDRLSALATSATIHKDLVNLHASLTPSSTSACSASTLAWLSLSAMVRFENLSALLA